MKTNRLILGLAVALGSVLAALPPASAASRALGKLRDGTYYAMNEIKVALTAEFASQLSPTGPGRRPVDKLRLRSLHRHVQEIRGGHTAAERWLDGQALPSHIRQREGEVPRMARSVTLVLMDGVDAVEVLAEVQALPEVEGAALSMAYSVAGVPNDPDYGQQWNMSLIKADEAWDISPRTTGIDIAIVDTGVDLDHPDLAGAITYQRGFGDFSSGDHPPRRTEDKYDTASHGTHVAGIAAAIRNNDVGVAGVARAKIMAMGCARWNDSSNKYFIANAPDAINDAIANGADVINCSFGKGPDSSLDLFMLWALDNARDHGVFVVCSAGNDSGRVDPGKSWDQHEQPFIVSATRADDYLAGFSNWGEAIDLAAPGVDILSTVVNGYASNNWSGTSMAAPHVAGAAALLMSMNPSLVSDLGVRRLLARMAKDIGSSLNYGSGRLELPRAFVQVLRNADHFVVTNPDLMAFGTGSYGNPYPSLLSAVAGASDGDTIVLSGRIGSIHEPPMTITKAVVLTAFPDRSGVIGQRPFLP